MSRPRSRSPIYPYRSPGRGDGRPGYYPEDSGTDRRPVKREQWESHRGARLGSSVRTLPDWGDRPREDSPVLLGRGRLASDDTGRLFAHRHPLSPPSPTWRQHSPLGDAPCSPPGHTHSSHTNRRLQSQNVQRFSKERRFPSPRHTLPPPSERRPPSPAPLHGSVLHRRAHSPERDGGRRRPGPAADTQRSRCQDRAPRARSRSPRAGREGPRAHSFDRLAREERWIEGAPPQSQARKFSVSPPRIFERFGGRNSYLDESRSRPAQPGCPEEPAVVFRERGQSSGCGGDAKRGQEWQPHAGPRCSQEGGRERRNGNGCDNHRQARPGFCERGERPPPGFEPDRGYHGEKPAETRPQAWSCPSRGDGDAEPWPNRAGANILHRLGGRGQRQVGKSWFQHGEGLPVRHVNGDVDLRRPAAEQPRVKLPHRGSACGPRRKEELGVRREGDGRSLGVGRSSLGMESQETLTIKVDMTRSLVQYRPVSYSSDRQLSLDLVSVGQQRPDFLPMLQHSGSYRERPGPCGDFAQEIITLLHQVKETYFSTEGLTLNERFSCRPGPEDGAPRINRRIDVSLSDLRAQKVCRDAERLQSGPRQINDPNDLRHGLERRRQAREMGSFSDGGFPERRTITDRSDRDFRRGNEEHNNFSLADWPGSSAESQAGHCRTETGSVMWKKPGYVRAGLNIQSRYGRQQPVRQSRTNPQSPHRPRRETIGPNW
ncbi:BCLAF1 and THRAP3 family member 3 isoform X2 [Amia ocellicauda]|uniref:BCLAF1 and THRAP3 family member 3 isoform X2 n=1 Tax=Amia ocellicauda TaxID=2972642 RepID=UPI003463DAB9